MDRRSRTTLTCALSSGALALALAAGPPSSAAPPAPAAASAPAADTRPNILLISSDDQNDDDLAYMPLTQRLIADHGVDVTGFVSPHPLCCPARAEILTGEYAQNNGVRHNTGPTGGWDAFLAGGHDGEQLGAWLHRGGYQTGFVGKMLNKYDPEYGPLNGFDHWNPLSAGLYRYYGSTFYNDGDPQTWPDDHVSDVTASYARDYLREFTAADAPWFLWVSHIAPHQSSIERRNGLPVPATRHAGLFADAVPPSFSQRSFNEQDMTDKPREIADADPLDPAWVTKLYQMRLRTLQSVDEANAALIRQLRRSGELENTIVVYLSDNGFMLGEHRLLKKNYPYEENFQVPFLIRGPGLPEGVTVDDRLSMVDVAPTLLAAAGVLGDVRRAGHTDGMVMDRVLKGRARAPRTQLVQGGTDDPAALASYGWWWRGVTTDRWTYTHWWNGDTELYDRRQDPQQLHNLVGDRSYTPVLLELQRRLTLLENCQGVDRCRRDLGPEPRR